MRLAAVTGRFQPVHAGHLELFTLALRDSDHLVVAITNPDPGARHEEPTSAHRHTPSANPFTYLERLWLLTAAVGGAGLADRVSVVPFDLTRPAQWPQYVPLAARQVVRVFSAWERDKADRLAAAGYPVTVVDGDPATKIDASDVRARLVRGELPPDLPAATVPLLRSLLAERPMSERS